MENTKCSSHPAAKKCQSASSPIWGRQGEWVKYAAHEKCCNKKDDGKLMADGPDDCYAVHGRSEYDLPLTGGLCGVGVGGNRKLTKSYSDNMQNWESAFIESELAHAEEVAKFSERFKALDRAYRSKLRKLENEYAGALEQGFEEAYSVVLEVQSELKRVKDELVRCYEVMSKCCPGELPKSHAQKCCG